MSDSSSWVAIQRNPKSGSGVRDGELLKLVKGLRRRGIRAHLFTSRQRLDQKLSSDHARESLMCIVAAGGDGTVDDLINRYPGVPLAILAMGTENLLAKYYRIPHQGDAVAEMIAQGHTHQIDLGQVNGHRFAVMASCGFDAHVVDLAHQARQGHITKLHYLKPILQTLWSYRHPLITVQFQSGKVSEGEMVIVNNLPSYAMQIPVNPDAQDDDNQLDVLVITKANFFSLFRGLLQGLLTGKIQSANFQRFQSESLMLTSQIPVPIQADGDPVSQTPIEIKTIPQALTLHVPKAVSASINLEEPQSGLTSASPIQENPQVPTNNS